MQQKDINGNTKDKAEDIKDWRDEHGRPSLSFLQSLADDGSPRALEKLKAIAQDLDVNYSPNTTPEELIDKILADVRSDPTITT
ncbi:hypothetical protein A2380_03935 [candidate division WWE3 bacterium RIFOXYB1_FULL_43_24]|uniref:Uncharacterized protein n=2 Tax=Katanobacteria TaxID=422282 RepID=A0A0G1BNT6_UNCKA|nr:MAG: hypothetical protein UU92_C0003G0044 [candidate division WWE3 bacterium GW2011_GWA1_42_12]KKS33780.1 MAG: hypothetical protein UU97_C0021G0006 [candidate division WWE3 bacterium GW2011_GWD1_42_14]KKS39118.1 MAG: hypothetical protein UV00_C0004G0044 [candidate division WWE3 bacterium GW2011_GWF1_42_14]KKS40648.1 MAG: hypothetical protein UV03_C0004G0044 [candidate division WWE3 bacterium GW2011_GWE1_42_16]KKS65356.1 MAG: hypothetical protein UV35_C0043G0001 [candidate division WWE3 bacte